jgi:hypothetical protein
LDLLEEFEKKKKTLPHKFNWLVQLTIGPRAHGGCNGKKEIEESKWANAKPGELTKKGK